MIGQYEVPLTLATVCGGALEEEFQKAYPGLVKNLKQGEKATVTITLEIKRVPETTSMMSLSYKVAAKAPARSNATVAQIFGSDKLMVEPAAPKQEKLRVLGGSANVLAGQAKGDAINE